MRAWFKFGDALTGPDRHSLATYDLSYQTDGHPDCIQTYGGGFATVMVARSLRDAEIQSRGRDRGMLVSIDVDTAWTTNNAGLRSTETA